MYSKGLTQINSPLIYKCHNSFNRKVLTLFCKYNSYKFKYSSTVDFVSIPNIIYDICLVKGTVKKYNTLHYIYIFKCVIFCIFNKQEVI